MTYSFIEPLFSSVGIPLAIVALHVLTIGAATVGLCFGVLLPKVLPGACFGASFAILISLFLPYSSFVYAMVLCPALALVGGVISIK